MRYYYHPGSPNCRKVTAVLDLLGVGAECYLVDLPRGEQLQPAFLAINPNGKVPVLVEEDHAIWESNANVTRWLGELDRIPAWRDSAPPSFGR